MSFIDTLKSLFGFTSTKETVEVPMMETPAAEPMRQAPVEEVMMSEPVVETMESDMSADAPMTDASVETMSETAMPTENQ